MITSEWSLKTLEEISIENICYGVIQPGSEDKEEGVYLIRGGDFPSGKINISTLRTISKKISEKYQKTVIRGGELLVSLVGYPGAVTVVPKELTGSNIARQAAMVRCSDSVNPHFVYYYLASREGQKKILEKVLGSAQQVINIKDLKKVTIPIPGKPEQDKIAEVLSTWDDAIGLMDALLKSLDVLNENVSRKIFNSFEDIKVFRLDEIADVRDGTHDSPKYHDVGVALVTSKNLRKGKLVLDQVSYISVEDADNINKRSKVSLNDILFSMIGTVGEIVFLEDVPTFCIKNIGLIKPNHAVVDSRYLSLYLSSPVYQKELKKSLDGGNQKFISLSGLRSIKVPVPNLQKQYEIVSTLKSITTLRDRLEDLKIFYVKQKSGIAQNLFAGNIRVKA